MLLLVLLALVQSDSSLERRMLEAEDARAENPTALFEGLRSEDPGIQRLAVRGLGRFERVAFADAIRPFLTSADAGIRMEAVNAFGQMNTAFDYPGLLQQERDPRVRGVIYRTIGRMGGSPDSVEPVLAAGLREDDPAVRRGAAHGLEAYFRARRNRQPAAGTLTALRTAATRPESQELALLTLNTVGDRHESTLRTALQSDDPQIRRLAVIGLKEWVEDSSPMVQYEALRLAPDCARARTLFRGTTLVALLAIDQLGTLKCDPALLASELETEQDWRRRNRLLMALARSVPEQVSKFVESFVGHDVWQVRATAAEAAQLLGDAPVLTRLINDAHPNVIAAAISTPADALKALSSADYGLLMAAAQRLRGWENGSGAVPALLTALSRTTAEQKATSRDPRTQMLERLREFGDATLGPELERYLDDFDPEIARLAAEIVSEKSGNRVEPRNLRYTTRPLPPEDYFRGLNGATARIRMREAGVLTLQLETEDAPVTVATFARLADQEHYNGLSLHRVAPNFVLQGGSPAANEYVGIADYMRDELGLLSHLRGTLGISTRGRDTGDAQIFFNLVDNYRLDHEYTVFARVVEGIEVMDRIREGDVIESITIVRR